MFERTLRSAIIHTDDTRVPVLDPTLPKTRKGRFWVYVGDVRNPYVVYDCMSPRPRGEVRTPVGGSSVSEGASGPDQVRQIARPQTPSEEKFGGLI
jgi:hypothetical protein